MTSFTIPPALCGDFSPQARAAHEAKQADEREQAEAADPSLKIARLYREAADLRDRAFAAQREGTEFLVTAIARAEHGDAELAHIFCRRAEAASWLAWKLAAQALTKLEEIETLRRQPVPGEPS